MKGYVEPEFKKKAFNCPYCEVYAHQKWRYRLMIFNSNSEHPPNSRYDQLRVMDWSTSKCDHCGEISFWHDEQLIYPKSSIAPLPNEDMPDDVKEDYIEAKNIVNDSPRGACALLRLALQKLMPHLEESGKNLNEDIGNLVKKGISSEVQKALDSVRVIGNNAVHPGELDLKDDVRTAISLFRLINYIVDNQISSKKEIDGIFEGLPQMNIEAIKRRDK